MSMVFNKKICCTLLKNDLKKPTSKKQILTIMQIDLKSFIKAIAKSITDVQKKIEQQQLENTINSYFTKEKDTYKPILLEVDIPHSNPQQLSTEKYQVPLFNLVHHSSLHINEASIAFEIGINSIALDKYNDGSTKEIDKILFVDQSRANNASILAKIELKLKSSNPSEGLARASDELIKYQGIKQKT